MTLREFAELAEMGELLLKLLRENPDKTGAEIEQLAKTQWNVDGR